MLTVGIDEVGRGSLAGPLVAGAVILKPNFNPNRLRSWKCDDSKLLTKKQRETAELQIRKVALDTGLGWVSAAEIDRIGLTAAVRLAMERALAEIRLPYHEIIIDGNYNFLSADPRAKAIIQADALVPAVSAASIIAKVARDNYMAEQAKEFLEYGFEKHVGYGTRLHLEKLKIHGPCAIHRRSFAPLNAKRQLPLLQVPALSV